MTARGATVLVVDDDAAIRSALAGILEEEGYRAVTAADGREALDVCDRERPNLILLDLGMPGMDGWAFLDAWRARGREPRCHVVLMSGLAFVKDAEGVADFLPKPVDPARLLSCVRRLCPPLASPVQ